jgi:hypothetical protein
MTASASGAYSDSLQAKPPGAHDLRAISRAVGGARCGKAWFDTVTQQLGGKAVTVRTGTLVDATVIASAILIWSQRLGGLAPEEAAFERLMGTLLGEIITVFVAPVVGIARPFLRALVAADAKCLPASEPAVSEMRILGPR